jgi:hypothetical protein
MENIAIAASERSPEVVFDFATGVFKLKGESYPEDVASFYGPLVNQLDKWLKAETDREVRFDIELVYFNSSSAKALMNILMLLEKAAVANSICVNWFYNADDDTMQEFGEDFAEDLEKVTFNLCAVEAAGGRPGAGATHGSGRLQSLRQRRKGAGGGSPAGDAAGERRPGHP